MAKKLQPGGDVRSDWRTVNELCDEVEALQKLVFQLRQDAQRRQIFGAGQENLFNIYQSSTWLKYKVTAGYLITTGNPITVTNTETEITITTGVARYWFYLDVTATTAAIATSATTLTWDATNKIPIGWVDTDTYSAESRAVIHQREHIFVPCAI
jgi:hypothetical protein